MPMMKLFELKSWASSRLIPNVAELNGAVVKAGGGVPGGSPWVQMPTTGSAFDSLGALLSSNAVTATDKVRFACAAIRKYPTSPQPLTEPAQSPGCGTAAATLQCSSSC